MDECQNTGLVYVEVVHASGVATNIAVHGGSQDVVGDVVYKFNAISRAAKNYEAPLLQMHPEAVDAVDHLQTNVSLRQFAHDLQIAISNYADGKQ